MNHILLEIKWSTIISFLAYPFIWVLATWQDFYVTNETYVQFVLGAIMVDWFFGSIYHFKVKRDFTLKKNIKGLVLKIGLVLAVGFIFEGIGYFVQDATTIQSITLGVLRLTVFLFPGLSALWTIYLLSDKKFPPIGVMNKLTQFNEELKIDEDE